MFVERKGKNKVSRKKKKKKKKRDCCTSREKILAVTII